MPGSLPLTLPGWLKGQGTAPPIDGGPTGPVTPGVGVRYNYRIGGLPFLSAAGAENPIVRETAPFRKQQFDTSGTPGENSLEGWWIRSQQSFHGGAGQLFLDLTDDNPQALIRFRDSRNVNVWEPGKVTLLNDVNAYTDAGSLVDMTEFNYGDGTASVFAAASDGRYLFAPSLTTHTLAASPGGVAGVQSVTTDGTTMFVATSVGIWSSPVPATPAGAWSWTKQYALGAGSSPVVIEFVKQRLMLAVGPSIYELAPYPSTPPAAIGSAKYVAPDASWSWTGFTEGANAIYVVGRNKARGSILQFGLSATGTIPTLAGGAVAAELPAGEIPYSIKGYLGNYIGIGTNKGVRCAVADTNGSLTYGPQLFSTPSPVYAWTARDTFLFCAVTAGVDGDSGVVRIDLSTQVSELRFAYATDVNSSADSTECKVIANIGSPDLIVFGTANALYVEDATRQAPDGYVRSSRIRFGTLEPKLFKFLRARGPALLAPLTFIILDDGDHESGSFTFPTDQSPGDVQPGIFQPPNAQDFISVKFVLNRSEDGGAELWGFQVKALPGTRRQRMIQLPLWCFDWESDQRGLRAGGRGTAFRRLSALEELEQTGDVVYLQDLDNGTSVQCSIDQLSFKQTTPPPNMNGVGGIITLTLRTV